MTGTIKTQGVIWLALAGRFGILLQQPASSPTFCAAICSSSAQYHPRSFDRVISRTPLLRLHIAEEVARTAQLADDGHELGDNESNGPHGFDFSSRKTRIDREPRADHVFLPLWQSGECWRRTVSTTHVSRSRDGRSTNVPGLDASRLCKLG